MTRLQQLNAFLTERLEAAGRDIVSAVGAALAEYREEAARAQRENHSLRRQLRDVLLLEAETDWLRSTRSTLLFASPEEESRDPEPRSCPVDPEQSRAPGGSIVVPHKEETVVSVRLLSIQSKTPPPPPPPPPAPLSLPDPLEGQGGEVDVKPPIYEETLSKAEPSAQQEEEAAFGGAACSLSLSCSLKSHDGETPPPPHGEDPPPPPLLQTLIIKTEPEDYAPIIAPHGDVCRAGNETRLGNDEEAKPRDSLLPGFRRKPEDYSPIAPHPASRGDPVASDLASCRGGDETRLGNGDDANRAAAQQPALDSPSGVTRDGPAAASGASAAYGFGRNPRRGEAAAGDFRCSRCGEAFSHAAALRLHAEQQRKPYACDWCCKSFAQSADLRRHLRTHTGERPHRCTFCSKGFSQRGNLRRHLRIHTGERPYGCPCCRRTFSDGDTMKKHVRTHSGERPYRCARCARTFTTAGGLQAHLKKDMCFAAT